MKFLIALIPLVLAAQVDVRITPSDRSTTDAFGRLRTSLAYNVFDSTLQYSKQPIFWNELIVGAPAATSVHDPLSSSVVMTVGTTNGNRVVRQSKVYHHYQPGKSQLIIMTGLFANPKANLRQMMGYFDDNDGVFFRFEGTTFAVCVRSSTTGVVTTSCIDRAQWNVTKLDGSGSPIKTLDLTRTQIFVIDLQWLGVGKIRFGFSLDGETYYVHEVRNSNILTLPYMSTASLPVRYEIVNTGTTASLSTMRQICSAVMSEGAPEEGSHYSFGVSNIIARTAANGVETAILAIRPKATFGTRVNRVIILPYQFEVLVNSQEASCRMVVGTITLGGSPSWTSMGDNSAVEFDVAGTTVTGGDTIVSTLSGDAATGTVVNEHELRQRISITLSIAGDVADMAVIVCRGLGGTSNLRATINWTEVR